MKTIFLRFPVRLNRGAANLSLVLEKLAFFHNHGTRGGAPIPLVWVSSQLVVVGRQLPPEQVREARPFLLPGFQNHSGSFNQNPNTNECNLSIQDQQLVAAGLPQPFLNRSITNQ